jgi:hypothetical protein
MNNYYIALEGIIYTLFIEYFIDGVITKLNIKDNSKYFLLHFIFNMFIMFLTYTDSYFCLLNPLNNYDKKFVYSGIFTTGCISGFHIYHMIFYKIRDIEEWIHHIVSCLVVPFIGVTIPFGYGLSLCNFIMCGLPGGVDYLLLFLVKYNIIKKMTEKNINRFLNLFIRYPMFYLTCYILLVNYVRNNNIVDNIYLKILMFFGMFLHLSNAAYYCDKVIGNYYYYLLL